MATELYSISGDFPNGRTASGKLDDQIRASGIAAVLDGVLSDVATDTCSIVFATPLTPGEKAVLDGVVAAHDGLPFPSRRLLQVIPLVVAPVAMAPIFSDAGDAIFDVEAAVPILPQSVLTVSCELAAAAGTMSLRLLETDAANISITLGDALNVTAGAVQFTNTIVPRAGLNRYRVQARLQTAAAATLTIATLKLFRQQRPPATPP